MGKVIKISLTALLPDNTIGIAPDVERSEGPFKCTFCHQDMIIRKGSVKVHHFAHIHNSTCPYASGETMEHEMAKLNLYSIAKSRGIEAKMEDVLSEHVRADLTLMTYKGKIAIEFQKSGMTDEYANLRMEHYKETGIPVIWIMLKNDNYPEHGGEHTATTKDLIFYNLYGNIIYTLYKDDLVDVWRLERIYRNESLLTMYRKWIHLSQLSLLDFTSFKLDDSGNLILPKPGKAYPMSIEFLQRGNKIFISSWTKNSIWGLYQGYSPKGIKFFHNGGDIASGIEIFSWNDINEIFYESDYGTLLCYVTKELRENMRKQYELQLSSSFERIANSYYEEKYAEAEQKLKVELENKYEKKYKDRIAAVEALENQRKKDYEERLVKLNGAFDKNKKWQEELEEKRKSLSEWRDYKIDEVKDYTDYKIQVLKDELIQQYEIESPQHSENIIYDYKKIQINTDGQVIIPYRRINHSLDVTNNERHLRWYMSHDEYNWKPVDFALNCIGLVYQCGYDTSYEILNEWIKMGFLQNVGQRIVWAITVPKEKIEVEKYEISSRGVKP